MKWGGWGKGLYSRRGSQSQLPCSGGGINYTRSLIATAWTEQNILPYESHSISGKLASNLRQVYCREIGADNRNPWDSTHCLLIRTAQRAVCWWSLVSLPIIRRGRAWLPVKTASTFMQLPLGTAACRSNAAGIPEHEFISTVRLKLTDICAIQRIKTRRAIRLSSCGTFGFDTQLGKAAQLFSIKPSRINPRLARSESRFHIYKS